LKSRTPLAHDGTTLVAADLDEDDQLQELRQKIGLAGAGVVHDQIFHEAGNTTVRLAMDDIETQLATLSYPDFMADKGIFSPALLGAMWDVLRSTETAKGLNN
jgi:hypothetical protein